MADLSFSSIIQHFRPFPLKRQLCRLAKRLVFRVQPRQFCFCGVVFIHLPACFIRRYKPLLLDDLALYTPLHLRCLVCGIGLLVKRASKPIVDMLKLLICICAFAYALNPNVTAVSAVSPLKSINGPKPAHIVNAGVNVIATSGIYEALPCFVR